MLYISRGGGVDGEEVKVLGDALPDHDAVEGVGVFPGEFIEGDEVGVAEGEAAHEAEFDFFQQRFGREAVEEDFTGGVFDRDLPEARLAEEDLVLFVDQEGGTPGRELLGIREGPDEVVGIQEDPHEPRNSSSFIFQLSLNSTLSFPSSVPKERPFIFL